MERDLRDLMKSDSIKARARLKEIAAVIAYCSKATEQILRKPLVALGVAAILTSCGLTRESVKNEKREQKTEQVADKTAEVSVKSQEQYTEYGYSDPNEKVETPEERSEREAEEEYWRIMEGKQTHGEAGTDKTDYGKPGKGADSRLSEKDLDKIYEAKSKVGRGVDDDYLAEIDKEIKNKSSDETRDISFVKAARDAGYGR